MCDEIEHLNAVTAIIRRRYHDLVAAARATLGAAEDGEPDPLYYLRDELTATGHLQRRIRRREGAPMSQRPSRHQMRRRVRRMHRYGLQPIAIIDPSDPMPDVAIMVIGRWIWRYRSELAPFGIALATAAAAWWLHSHDAHWWLLIAAVAAASVPVLAVAGSRIGLADLTERIYVFTVTASAGAWLAAATAAGPAQRPFPLLILIGTLVLAVPWWTHRRRRARIRVERKLAAWPDIAQAVGLAGSRVLSALVDIWVGALGSH